MAEPFGEAAAITPLQNEVRLALVFAALVNRHDGRVPQRREGLGFRQEPLGGGLVWGRPGADHLDGVVSATYTATVVSAAAGSDYSSVTGVVTFGPGVTVQTVSVPIQSDALAEGTETFRLSLSNPTGPAPELGPQRTTLVNIHDRPVASPINLSNEVSVPRIGRRVNGVTGRTIITLRVRNGCGSDLRGPLYLLLGGQTQRQLRRQRIRVLNADAFASPGARFGAALRRISTGADSILRVRESTTIQLAFANPLKRPFNFTTAVWAGPLGQI